MDLNRNWVKTSAISATEAEDADLATEASPENGAVSPAPGMSSSSMPAMPSSESPAAQALPNFVRPPISSMLCHVMSDRVGRSITGIQ